MPDFFDLPAQMIRSNGCDLAVRTLGSGPPLVLLHGFPQSYACWHRVAPALAGHFQLILPDLRGYGHSGVPEDDPEHTTYSKRAMAQDVIAIADALGLDRFAILGHDRGARVSYRLGFDHPDRVSRIGILEILPTAAFWNAWSADLAYAAYHWTFLAQKAPLPETLIAGAPDMYFSAMLQGWTGTKSLDIFDPRALAAYLDAARDSARVAAYCADYRAGATTDRRIDEEELATGRRLQMPVACLFASKGFPVRAGNPEGVWSEWAENVTCAVCESGHFIPEEAPQAVIDMFREFFLQDFAA